MTALQTAPPQLQRRPSAIRLRPSPAHSPMQLSPATISPVTALAGGDTTPPSTPPFNGYQGIQGGWPRRGSMLLRRRSSLSSVNSSMDGGDEESEEEALEWTEGEKEVLRRTVDNYVAQASTTESPFCGAPPSNLTQIIARAILSSTPPSTPHAHGDASSSSTSTSNEGGAGLKKKWRHGLKSTRAKILALVKERQSSYSYSVEDTPRADPDATPRKRRTALVRQGSMDFLPENGRNVAVAARLGSKLQRSDSSSSTHGPPLSASSFIAHQHHHPYASLHRTHSLSSIAGSPTQPIVSKKSSRMQRVSSAQSSTPPASLGLGQGLGGGVYQNPLMSLMGLNSNNKRSAPMGGNGEGLQSAFVSPAIVDEKKLEGSGRDGYPSPPKSTKKPRRNTEFGLGLGLALGQAVGGTTVGGGGEGLQQPFGSSLAVPFPSVGASSSTSTSQPLSVPRLSAGFFFGGSEENSEYEDTTTTASTSYSSATTFSTFSSRAATGSSFFSSSSSSLGMEDEASPSPMRSDFDLLSLGFNQSNPGTPGVGGADEEMWKMDEGEDVGGFLDRNYVEAGLMKQKAERDGWDWGEWKGSQ